MKTGEKSVIHQDLVRGWGEKGRRCIWVGGAEGLGVDVVFGLSSSCNYIPPS